MNNIYGDHVTNDSSNLKRSRVDLLNDLLSEMGAKSERVYEEKK